MSKKNSSNRDEIEKTRKSLDDSIGNLLDDENLLDDSRDRLDTDLPAVRPKRQNDYAAMKGRAEEKAKKTIMSLMKFYLSAEIIEEDEYVKAKRHIDEMTLGSLLFQLEAGEKALVTLLETIDDGELGPRMFEVLATLQKSMLDIIKSQTMYLMAAEEGTKKLSRDIEIYTDLKTPKNIGQGNGSDITNLNRGTKNLMQKIQEDIKNEKPEEVEEIKVKPIVSNDLSNSELNDITSVEDVDDDDDIDEIQNSEEPDEDI